MGPPPVMMARSSPRPPSPQGRPHGCTVFQPLRSGLGQEGATSDPAGRVALRLDPTVSHPRGLEASATSRTHRLLPPRPPMDAAAPDPDLGHDDLVCRTDRCRAVPHGANLLRLRPLPQAKATRQAL